MTSTHYTIWKDQTAVEYPWVFEGDEWGDTGSCATFEEALAATVGASSVRVLPESNGVSGGGAS